MLARSPSADRKRRYRARQRRGRVVVGVEVDRDAVLLALLASGRLGEAEALQPDQVAAALGDVIEQWARRWRD
jgi:hypothetical protein